MDEYSLKSKIFFYFREKYFTLMLNSCKEGMTKYKGDVSFHLFHSLALMLINRLEEGVHDLETIRDENDVKLAVTIALMYGHKLLGVTNKELFVRLDNQMREYRKQSDAIDFYYSGFVLVALNKVEKALDYVDKALNMESSLSECQTLKGWILLLLHTRGLIHKVPNLANAKDLFENSFQGNTKNQDTMLGLSEYYVIDNNLDDALNTINRAVVRYTSSVLPLLQKMKVTFASHDYDQTLEICNRITNTERNNLLCMRMRIVILLIRDAAYEEATNSLKTFTDELKTIENNNSEILLQCSKLFARICGRNENILSQCNKMLEIALQIHSDNIDVIIELGYQCLLNGKIKEALRYFKTATKIDETSLNALLGLSLCELAENGKTTQLCDQVNYLMDLNDANNSCLLRFIRAKIADNSVDSLIHLKSIADIQTNRTKNIPYCDLFLLTFDPDFMLDVVKEYLQHISSTSSELRTNINSNMIIVYNLLKTIVKICPGLVEGVYLLAKLEYLKGDSIILAQTTLEKILDKSTIEANLLLAQIQIQNGQFERAAQCLEMCVSENFRVRENPLYHYITAVTDKHLKNYADAVKSLTTALALVNLKANTTYKTDNSMLGVSLVEKASIYVELIDTLNIIGQNEEAAKVLEDATEELRGTPEEARILLLSADHALERNNIQSAIDLLTRIKPGENCYLMAKTKHADILLNYRKDHFAYLQCYKDLLNENENIESYILLGDAYMTVLEPDDALECYEKALKMNPKDSYLTTKMGKALVKSHYFARAVNYYKETIKSTQDSELKLQLAELYMNLREYDKGQLILIEDIENDKGNDDLIHLQYKTKLLSLLAQIQEKSGSVQEAIKTLKDAMDNQNRVRKRLNIDKTTGNSHEIDSIVGMALKLGEMAISLKNNDKAIGFFKEGLEVSPNNTMILGALAKLYMQMNFLELCQQTCSSILRIDPENESASVMMADIAFRKVDFDMALFHFTQLITKQPTNWEALIRLIEILRRTGNIQDCPEYINAAKQNCENPLKETKFLFCKAMYEWYSGNLNNALKNFNNARQDPQFGQLAIYNMIEICLNPDDEMFAEQFSDSDDIEYRDSRTMALKTADRLLKELKQRLETNGDDMIKYRLLTNFRLLATKDKYNIERALEDFLSLASQNAYKDNIGAILGIATAHTLLKQSQRAKNQLKRIVKTIWTFEDAEYLERCWLLLADYYLQSAKYDIATDLINKVVQHNKACTKAYEYLGFIAEKEQRYKDAANYYENAWKYGGRANPAIGYKLAYSLMKSKRYPDAIDVAQEVLKLSPDYPRVKKDILDKSMNNLRI